MHSEGEAQFAIQQRESRRFPETTLPKGPGLSAGLHASGNLHWVFNPHWRPVRTAAMGRHAPVELSHRNLHNA